jgi:hypothetical protein
MASFTLDSLIESLANAVVEAQERIEKYQISLLSGYFDENHRPRAVDLRLPSLSPSAQPGDERIIHVPLLALVGSPLLNIKDVEITFDVALNGLGIATPAAAPASSNLDAPPTNSGTATWSAPPPGKTVGVDMGAPDPQSGTSARIILRVESREPTEGMSRLLMHLNKLV